MWYLTTVQFKAHGGGYERDSDDEDLERERPFRKRILKQSHEPGCLIGYDDDTSCIGCKVRHAMAVECLEKNIKAVTMSYGKTVLADMIGEEYEQWSSVIEKQLEPSLCIWYNINIITVLPVLYIVNCKAGYQRKQGVCKGTV